MSKYTAYLYNGRLMSRKDIVSSSGISIGQLAYMINKNNIVGGGDVTLFIDQLLSIPWTEIERKQFIYQGQLMHILDICESVGLRLAQVNCLINKEIIKPGHDVTSLIDDRRKVGERCREWLFMGKLMGIKELSEKSWVLYSTVLRRIKSGNYPAGSDVTELVLNPLRKVSKWLFMGKLMGPKELSENSCVGYNGIIKRIKSGNYPAGSDVTELVLRGFCERQMKRTQVKKGDQ
ncbi:MAG: hypothetical protein ACJAYB_000109 [Psychromonas sp.]|jgi:hypothetical protein